MTNKILTSERSRLTAKLLDPYTAGSVTARARAKRWARLVEAFPDLKSSRVLDLGGTVEFWNAAPVQPAQLTIVNLDRPKDERTVHGDACDPPAAVLERGYDVVISNSLIEHVGGHVRRQQLAEVIRSAAPHHWVQTPYRYFPVEPHWVFPGLQFLPFAAKVEVTKRWPVGYMHHTDHGEAVAAAHEVELMSATQMRSYFPDSTMWYERLAGLPKSIVAIR